MNFRRDNDMEDPSVAELLADLGPYENRLDHLVYLQERMREAAEREGNEVLTAFA